MSVTITKRRIQRLGGSSLIVTIPKGWAKKIGLRVGDMVVVVDKGDRLEILPPDSKVNERIGVAQAKLAGYLRDMSIDNIINCVYVNGYSRLAIKLPSSDNKNLDKVLDDIRRNSIVKHVELTPDGDLLVELDIDNGESVTMLLKLFNTNLQQIIDIGEKIIEGETTLDYELQNISRIVNETYRIVDSISRKSFKQGLIMCEAEGVDPTLLVSFKIITRLLERAVKTLAEYKDKELSKRILDLIRMIVSESIGGIASQSGRRMVNSLKLIEELRDVVTEVMQIGTPEAMRLATCVESFAIAIDIVSSKSICSSLGIND
ncbi:MAG: AbrB/MazE/SpoVT family DNA-binding domain-containing protein [Desulfurococcales archaeon]|nr:AbrB/MazE/SpoVT family DNA-binding domain-containing protein [Desulfurococcales archaeon]